MQNMKSEIRDTRGSPIKYVWQPPCERRATCHYRAFSLVEVVTALIILAFVSSSVLVVINRCMASAADSAMRMQAFSLARDNMEKLLTAESVEQMVEYGSSDKYPEIQWQTTVEAFYEPVTARMWIEAVCSADYTDTEGQTQTIELTHWLTDLTKEQVLQILGEMEEERERLAEEVIETEDNAAYYAGVDVQTIRQWVENGMLLTKDGYYIKSWLDLYEQSNGKPTIEDRSRLAKEEAELIEERQEQGEKEEQGEKDESDKVDEKDEMKDEKETGGEDEEEYKYKLPDDMDPELRKLIEKLLGL